MIMQKLDVCYLLSHMDDYEDMIPIFIIHTKKKKGSPTSTFSAMSEAFS